MNDSRCSNSLLQLGTNEKRPISCSQSRDHHVSTFCFDFIVFVRSYALRFSTSHEKNRPLTNLGSMEFIVQSPRRNGQPVKTHYQCFDFSKKLNTAKRRRTGKPEVGDPNAASASSSGWVNKMKIRQEHDSSSQRRANVKWGALLYVQGSATANVASPPRHGEEHEANLFVRPSSTAPFIPKVTTSHTAAKKLPILSEHYAEEDLQRYHTVPSRTPSTVPQVLTFQKISNFDGAVVGHSARRSTSAASAGLGLSTSAASRAAVRPLSAGVRRTPAAPNSSGPTASADASAASNTPSKRPQSARVLRPKGLTAAELVANSDQPTPKQPQRPMSAKVRPTSAASGAPGRLGSSTPMHMTTLDNSHWLQYGVAPTPVPPSGGPSIPSAGPQRPTSAGNGRSAGGRIDGNRQYIALFGPRTVPLVRFH